MNLFEMGFDENFYRNQYQNGINDDDFADLIVQADTVIKDEKENPKRRAEAYVKKFQLLKTRHKLAPKLLEKAIVLYPDMPQALTGMGNYYLHIKDREKALLCFNKAIEAKPPYPFALLAKASIISNDEEKLRLYSKFIKLEPNLEIGYSRRISYFESPLRSYSSSLTRDKKKYMIRQIYKDYSELIRIDPSDYYYYEKRASLLLPRKHDESANINYNALKDIEQFMLLYPYSDLHNCIIGIKNWFNEWPNEITVKYLEQMMSDLPPDSNAYVIAQILYADNYNWTKNYEKAIEIYDKIINSVEDGCFLQMYCYTVRSRLYLRMKEFEKALYDNEMRIKKIKSLSQQEDFPTECDLYYARMDRINIFTEMHDIDSAVDEYTILLEELQNRSDGKYYITDAYVSRAVLFLQNNETEKALSDFSAVIELGHTGIRYHVKNAYAARIEIYKARGEMDKAFVDYIKMSELKEEDCLSPDEYPGYEIIDGE